MNLWIAALLLLILVAILVVLFSNIFVDLILDGKRKRGSLRWLCANFFWDWSVKKSGFNLFNQRIWTGSLEKKEKPKKKKKKKKRPDYFVLWQEKEVMLKAARIAFSSVVDLLKKSKIQRLFLDARIGTPDPALTGVLYGGISSVCFPLQAFLPRSFINVYPDFQTESLGGKAEIGVRTRIRDIFWILLRAFFLLPKRAIIKTMRKLKKSRR